MTDHQNSKFEWNVLACAVEDDQIVFLDATLTDGGDGVSIANVETAKSVARKDFIPGNQRDDQHDFDMQWLVKLIAQRVKLRRAPVHFIAISTFGTVNVATGNVAFYPHDRDVIARRGGRIDACLPELVRVALNRPDHLEEVIVDNDATAAALGEQAFGIGQRTDEFAHIWAGRGVNIGLVLNGTSWEGRLHPEAGHLLVRRHEKEPNEEGSCANHKGCIMGLATLGSIERRLAQGMSEEQVTKIIAYYYAQLCMTITLVAAPARISIGGIALRRLPSLLDMTKQQYWAIIGDYPRYVQQTRETFIAESDLSQLASALGMIEMTRQRVERKLYV